MKFKFRILIFIFTTYLLISLSFADEVYIDREIKPRVLELVN